MTFHHSFPVLIALAVALPLPACAGDAPAARGSGGAAGAAGASVTTGGNAGLPSGGTSGGGAAGSAALSGAAGMTAGGASGGAAGSAGAAVGGSGGGSSENLFGAGPKLMVLGSSNELITCWRAFLWKKLQDANIKDFDLVGDVSEGPDCGVPGYDKDLRAQSGVIVTNLTSQQFAGWFSAHPPDALLVHFGGADLLQNMPIPGIMAGYTRALEEARKVSPHVRFLIAQHTPQDSATCNDCENTVVQLNDEITTWATANDQPDAPVVVVDLYTGVDPAVDTDDGIHLNVGGSTKVADKFFAAVRPYFGP